MTKEMKIWITGVNITMAILTVALMITILSIPVQGYLKIKQFGCIEPPNYKGAEAFASAFLFHPVHLPIDKL